MSDRYSENDEIMLLKDDEEVTAECIFVSFSKLYWYDVVEGT